MTLNITISYIVVNFRKAPCMSFSKSLQETLTGIKLNGGHHCILFCVVRAGCRVHLMMEVGGVEMKLPIFSRL